MFSWWKLLLPTGLILLPLVVVLCVGAWDLVETGHWALLFWLFPVCWGAAWVARWWIGHSTERVLPPPENRLWTDRDETAFRQAIAEEEAVAKRLTLADLQLPATYEQASFRLAQHLGKHYFPGTRNPWKEVTAIELLTCISLAARDLERDVRKYVPGVHLVTLGQWQTLASLSKYAGPLGDLWSVASLGMAALTGNLFEVGARVAAGRAVMNPAAGNVAELAAPQIFVMYLERVAYYLIELYSGRLRGGAEAYDKYVAYLAPARDAEPQAGAVAGAGTAGLAPGMSAEGTAREGWLEPADGMKDRDTGDAALPRSPLTIAVVGQTSSGKSSLVNGLLGEVQAAVDHLPTTAHIDRYVVRAQQDIPPLVLLDTPGFEQGPAGARNRTSLLEAAQQADLLLWTITANQPAREADREALVALREHFARQPHLKCPPLLVVVTKVDLLSPRMEWQPPYEWMTGGRPKEIAIREAVGTADELFGPWAQQIFPIVNKTAARPAWNIDELLWPAIQLNLDEAKAVQLLRLLHNNYSNERATLVWTQTRTLATQGFEMVVQRLRDNPELWSGASFVATIVALRSMSSLLPATWRLPVRLLLDGLAGASSQETIRSVLSQLLSVLKQPDGQVAPASASPPATGQAPTTALHKA